MAAAATNTYGGDGLIPCWAPEELVTDAVQLIPGTYSAGQVLGQFSTLTAASDVQTLTVTGTPTGGSIRLAFNGQVTAAIAYNAAAADVQAALEALTNVGTGNVAVTAAGALPGNAQTITFQSYLGSRWQPLITVFSNSLTGGTTPAAAVVHTTPGRIAGGAFGAYDDTLSNGLETAKCVLKWGGVVDTFGNHDFPASEFGSVQKSAPAYFKGYFKTKELVGIDANACADLGTIKRGSTASLTSEATVLGIGC